MEHVYVVRPFMHALIYLEESENSCFYCNSIHGSNGYTELYS